MTNDLPFQYGQRIPEMSGLSEPARSYAGENRDRELEDYIGQLQQRIAKLEADQTQGIGYGGVPLGGS